MQGRIRNLILKSHHREIAPRSQPVIHLHRREPYRHTVVPAHSKQTIKTDSVARRAKQGG